uniref:Uncharacterized protein n=1 Tax=Trypanosoma congolense (strain IL3000) TaxID=1068625 RepID=G0UPK6_TRYCI|nr:conserved hypothetical protein [Trypanosoma congolense IL3000]
MKKKKGYTILFSLPFPFGVFIFYDLLEALNSQVTFAVCLSLERMANGDEDKISLAQLSEMGAKAEELRENLRKAFIDDAPRLEIAIFNSVTSLVTQFLQPSHTVGSSITQTQCSARYLVERYYLQEVFAALLLLVGEVEMDGMEVPVQAMPRQVLSTVPRSAFYVDVIARRYCLELLLYLCFSRVCRTSNVVRGIYPLLLETGPNRSDEVSENHVSEGLFSSSRFQSRKKVVSSLLNGIVLALDDGVRALLDVMLLDDKVDDSMSSHAAKHIAALFTSPLGHAWLRRERKECRDPHQQGSGPDVIMEYCKKVTFEEQTRLLASQLVRIAGCHANPQPEKVEPQLPEFLRRRKGFEEKSLIKPETLEERLHMCLATVMNTVSQLPPRSENEALFKCHYKRFYLYNKYFFSPAFNPLALRIVQTPPGSNSANAAPAGVDSILQALHRFSALAKGSTLGPSPLALLLALPPVAPGLLELLGIYDSLPSQHRLVLDHLLNALWRVGERYDEMARIFVCGALTPVRGSIVVDRVAGVVYVEPLIGSSEPRRIRGLELMLKQKGTPTAVCCNVLLAAAEECQQRAAACDISTGSAVGKGYSFASRSMKEFGGTVVPLNFLFTTTVASSSNDIPVDRDGDASGEDPEKVSEVLLARLVESICLDMDAEAVFGSTVTLDRVCDVLRAIATISPVCWQWSVLLIPKVFCVDVISSILAQHVTTAARQKAAYTLLRHAERLLAVLRSLRDAVEPGSDDVAAAAERALEAAMDAMQQCCDDSGNSRDGDGTMEGTVGVSNNNVAPDSESFTAYEYRRLVGEIERCLETRSVGSLAVHLLALSRMAEDSITDVCKRKIPDGDPLMAVVQKGFPVLIRVLTEVDDTCAAVATIQIIVWWALARLDSTDSSFVAKLLICHLLCDKKDSSSPTNSFGYRPGHRDRVGLLKVRLLDVLLGFCDYDTEGRTLRNIDDYCRRVHGFPLYNVLKELCGPAHPPAVQVATLHLVGYYFLAVYPRVSLGIACGLCADVFRHTPHSMAKAAAAAMLLNISSSVIEFDGPDCEALLQMAEAMRTYRESVGGSATDDEKVIRGHGECIRNVLQGRRLSVPVREL